MAEADEKHSAPQQEKEEQLQGENVEIVDDKKEEQNNENASEKASAKEETDETPEVEKEKAEEETPHAEEEKVEEETPQEEESVEEETEEQPKIKIEDIKTAPADYRFPTTNQTRHCFTRYIEYHKCIAAKGEGASECEKFARYYRALCPGEWIDRWNEQRESGTFPGPL
eukprot:TRINITY_DN1636_c0_g1_i1.p1 TRINITY_DN1636_c0_g1~~TRINITY_DN1636_c0_g1_i1.p1  ORF type:complete len:170 (-),score=68.60 TRINITY_DN1636_c0_g1_i1:71-580(-)